MRSKTGLNNGNFIVALRFTTDRRVLYIRKEAFMKITILRLLSIAMAAMLLLSLGACRKQDPPPQDSGTTAPDPDPDQTSGEPQDTDPVPTFDLTIHGTPISKYRIVYAHNPEKEAADRSQKISQNITDSDFDRQTAERLRDVIHSMCGIRLDVVEDTKTKEIQFEITVGATNRSTKKDLDIKSIPTDGYKIMTSGNHLAFGGKTYGNTWHAVDTFEKLLQDAINHGDSGFDFGEDFLLEDTYHLLRIGCIGDSITCGWNAEYCNYQYLTYPKLLGYSLWKDAVVTNYAHSGMTMRSYSETDEYQNCLKDAEDLDVVTIMLGTNDARGCKNSDWDTNRDRDFKMAAKIIVDGLRNKNPEIQILFLSSPEIFEVKDGVTGGAIRSVVKSQKEIPEFLKAQENPQEVDFYNMNVILQRYEEYTRPDGIHLTVEGLSLLAKKLAPVIRDFYLNE